MSEFLYIKDSRTSLEYQIPIRRNAVNAADFQAIKGPVTKSPVADQVGNGVRLFDPGFKNTAVSESKITFIEGSQGIVQYRGQSIGDFWDTAQYEDLLHLLVWGRWPSPEEKETVRMQLAQAAQNVPERVKIVIQAFPKTAAPMQMVIAGLAAFLGEDPRAIPAFSARNLYHGNLPLVDKAIIQTLAAFQVCAGLAAAHRSGVPYTSADINGNFLSNLLMMMGKVDKETGKPDPTAIYAIQRIWALGADLGHTNSTSAFLLGASTLSDPLSCLISALSSGYGILHFGAAEASFKSLAALGSKKKVPYLIEKVKRKEAKLYGYGHRMFATVDPRILYGAYILNDLKSNHPLVEVAMEIDRIASSDEYFTSRNIQANADLFIGIIYTALDFDPSFVPVMIALMRSGGMMAHWREAMSQPKTNIWRPQQFYTGEVKSTPAEQTAENVDSAASVLETIIEQPAATNKEAVRLNADLDRTIEVAATEGNLSAAATPSIASVAPESVIEPPTVQKVAEFSTDDFDPPPKPTVAEIVFNFKPVAPPAAPTPSEQVPIVLRQTAKPTPTEGASEKHVSFSSPSTGLPVPSTLDSTINNPETLTPAPSEAVGDHASTTSSGRSSPGPQTPPNGPEHGMVKEDMPNGEGKAEKEKEKCEVEIKEQEVEAPQGMAALAA